jgi:Prolyl oligopeptidase family
MAVLALTLLAVADGKRPIEPADCVKTRYLLDNGTHVSIQIDPTGSRVAYMIKEPDIESNQNNILVYVKYLSDTKPGMGRLVLSGPNIADVRWLQSGNTITALSPEDGHVKVIALNIDTGVKRILAGMNADIREYSTDRTGSIVAFAIDASDFVSGHASVINGAEGYRIPFKFAEYSWPFHRRVFVTKRGGDGKWNSPEVITLHSPFTGAAMTDLPEPGLAPAELNLSPTGTSLLLMYYEEYPDSWTSNPVIKMFVGAGYKRAPILVLQDLQTGKTSMPAKIPQLGYRPLWADDGRSFLVLSGGPLVGSPEEKRELENHAVAPDAKYLLLVKLDKGSVETITSTHDENVPLKPLWMDHQENVMVRMGAGNIATFSKIGGEWHQTKEISMPFPTMYPYGQLATDGKHFVGDYQDLMTPPELFTYEAGQLHAQVFAKLNPEFDQLVLATGKEIDWKTPTGYNASGLLLLPPQYDSTRRYPLVIQDYPWYWGQFLCDSGPSHDPSFLPQPFADAGIMYLIRTKQGESQRTVEASYFPKGYPGGIGEAVFNMQFADSAVDYLNEAGLIDPDQVGIIGFSRGGWYTEFTLAHSKKHYAAATTTDNIRYSMGEYWLVPWFIMTQADNMYGGPPYGTTLQNWLNYSISFNLDKIHTPLLIERMGNGKQYNDDFAPPVNVAAALEVFTGLSRLNKPAEFYYYPNEGHTPDNPQARLANFQRNYDWYRFWLQDYERPNPEDPDQYVRWRRLRTLRDIDAKTQNDLSRAGK